MRLIIYCACIVLLFAPTNLFSSSRDQIFNTLEGIKEHIDQKFEEATVETDPFPHLVIDNIFPQELYDKIALYWPAQNEFVGGSRTILPVTQGCLESTSLTTEQKIFWRLFGEVIVNRYVKPNIIKKLSSYFTLKLGMDNFDCNELNRIENFTNLRQDALIEDARNYKINSHIDPLNVFATLLLYLPQDSDHQDFGTSFYKEVYSGDSKIKYSADNMYSTSKVEFVKKVPYKPNTLVTFLQTPDSWHGVESVESRTADYTRRMYLAPLFLSPEFVQTHYSGVYKRHAFDEYFFDHRFLCRKNWVNIWGSDDEYK